MVHGDRLLADQWPGVVVAAVKNVIKNPSTRKLRSLLASAGKIQSYVNKSQKKKLLKLAALTGKGSRVSAS